MAAAIDSSNLTSDEAFARQLQQEEFRSMLPNALQNFTAPRASANSNNSHHANDRSSSQDISAPLLHDAAANPLLNSDANNVGVAQQQGNGNGNAAQRARRNVIGHVRDADTDSPRILLLRITIALLEVVATATVLAIGWNEGASTSCNYLKWWALVYSARHLVTIPLRIRIRYRMNRVPAPQPIAAQPQNGDNEINGDVDVQDVQGQGGNGVGVGQTAEKSIQVLRWLSIMTFLLFLLGQTFLFTEKTCQDTAPTVWYYCLVIIILVYVSLALPFLIVLAICICLPCVLIVFRFFAEPEGADDRMIKNLPTRKITAADVRGKGDGDGKEEVGDDEDARSESAGDAPSCAICMQDYKENDEVRCLPCGHEFHCECVDKWLPMKKICPLCRHDVTKALTGTGADSASQAAEVEQEQGQVNIDMDGSGDRDRGQL